MLISCPKCRAVYNISAEYIPENGKKFKCAECGYIWMVYPSDDTSAEPETEEIKEEKVVIGLQPAKDENQTKETVSDENDTTENKVENDIDVMFERLSHNTKNLFASSNAVENMTFSEKLRHYAANAFSVYALMAFLSVLFVVFGIMLIRDYRYEIVAKVPLMERIYTRFNLQSVYRGKNIKIKDVNLKNIYVDGDPYLEVSGKLYNDGKYDVIVLPVKASLITADGKTESEITEILSGHRLEPKFATLFRIVMNYPSPKARKVRITLDDIVNQ